MHQGWGCKFKVRVLVNPAGGSILSIIYDKGALVMGTLRKLSRKGGGRGEAPFRGREKMPDLERV